MKKNNDWLHLICFILCFYPVINCPALNAEENSNKLSFEILMGLGRLPEQSGFSSRYLGFDELLHQYAEYYDVEIAHDNQLSELKQLVPLQFFIKWRVAEGWQIKCGMELHSSQASSRQNYQLSWTGSEIQENYINQYPCHFSGFMPMIGVEKSWGNLSAFVMIAFDLMSLRLDRTRQYSEPGYSYEEAEKINIKKTIPATLFGLQYRIINLPIKIGGNPVGLIGKIEYLYGKTSTLKGTKSRHFSDSTGQETTEIISGTLYGYQENPLALGWVNTFDLLPTSTTPADWRDINPMGFYLSYMRIMIGFSL